MNEREALLEAIREAGGLEKRAWQRMLSGRRLDLLDPDPKDIEIEDIAHGLARVARWNGQTIGDHAFSVAEHSLFVTDIVKEIKPDVSDAVLLAGLLHDGAEYVVGDLISPFKAAIGQDYKVFELKLLDAIFKRFDIMELIKDADRELIKEADGIAAYFESVQLAGFSEEEARLCFAAPLGGAYGVDRFVFELEAHPVAQVQAAFIKRFQALR